MFLDDDDLLSAFFFVLLPADDEDDDAFGTDGVFTDAALTEDFAAFGVGRSSLTGAVADGVFFGVFADAALTEEFGVRAALAGAVVVGVCFALAAVFFPLPASSSEGVAVFLEDALLNASIVMREIPNAGTHELSEDGYLVRTNSEPAIDQKERVRAV